MYRPNATLTFTFVDPNSTEEFVLNPVTGNDEPAPAATISVDVKALLRPVRDPNAIYNPGTDQTRQYYEGRMIGTPILPLPPGAQATCQLDRYQGTFYLDVDIQSPHGADQIVGQRISGWFEVTGANS